MVRKHTSLKKMPNKAPKSDGCAAAWLRRYVTNLK
jgi:hypothetical protein